MSGTMATEINLNPLARYQRNDWHYITETDGTVTSELSTLEIPRIVTTSFRLNVTT